MEECDKPILRAGATWYQLMLKDRANPSRLEGQVGDYYSFVKGTLRIVVEPVAGYKVLHFQLHHETGDIEQDLYPDTPSGPGLFGTALNTNAPPQNHGDNGQPMGRPCPKRCRKKNPNEPIDFAQAPTGDQLLPECPEGPARVFDAPAGRSVSKRDVTGEPRAVSKRDIPTPPPEARVFPQRVTPSVPSYTPPPAPPTEPAPPPLPPRVQVLPGEPKAGAVQGPAIAPPVLAPQGSTENVVPDVKK